VRLINTSGEIMIDVAPDTPDTDPWATRLGSAIVVASRLTTNLDRIAARGAILPRGSVMMGLSLQRAALGGAQMYEVNLSGSDLSEADLSGADLRGAVFGAAKIAGANLMGANLMGADLSMISRDHVARSLWAGAKTVGMKVAGQALTRDPLSISGLTYEVTVLGSYMIIGCQMQTIDAWRSWSMREGIAADGKAGGRFATDTLPCVLSIVDQWNKR
jgi:uncharacterized protein YjbI with pentapeptide repeats